MKTPDFLDCKSGVFVYIFRKSSVIRFCLIFYLQKGTKDSDIKLFNYYCGLRKPH